MIDREAVVHYIRGVALVARFGVEGATRRILKMNYRRYAFAFTYRFPWWGKRPGDARLTGVDLKS